VGPDPGVRHRWRVLRPARPNTGVRPGPDEPRRKGQRPLAIFSGVSLDLFSDGVMIGTGTVLNPAPRLIRATRRPRGRHPFRSGPDRRCAGHGRHRGDDSQGPRGRDLSARGDLLHRRVRHLYRDLRLRRRLSARGPEENRGGAGVWCAASVSRDTPSPAADWSTNSRRIPAAPAPRAIQPGSVAPSPAYAGASRAATGRFPPPSTPRRSTASGAR
jgi:hypothetical protein